MSEVAEQIEAAGAEIIWVLEQDVSFQPGTATLCMDTLDSVDAPPVGWCVGDEQTKPVAGTFDDSPFSQGRGFDLIVPRSSMEVVWTSNHGTPAGNENLDGDAVLAEVERVVAGLR